MNAPLVDQDEAAADDRLGRLMLIGTLTVLVAAGVAIAAPASVADGPGAVAVGAVIALPLIRVLLLVRRWIAGRDLRFALAGGGLLAVIAIGTAIALLGR